MGGGLGGGLVEAENEALCPVDLGLGHDRHRGRSRIGLGRAICRLGPTGNISRPRVIGHRRKRLRRELLTKERLGAQAHVEVFSGNPCCSQIVPCPGIRLPPSRLFHLRAIER